MIQVGVLYFLAGVVGPLSIELTMGEGETAIWFVSTNWIWHPGIWYSKMLLFNPFRGLGWGLWFWCLLVAIQKVSCLDPNLVALSWWRPSWSLPWRPSWLPGSQWGGDNPGSHQLPDQASHGSLPRLWKVSSSPPSLPSSPMVFLTSLAAIVIFSNLFNIQVTSSKSLCCLLLLLSSNVFWDYLKSPSICCSSRDLTFETSQHQLFVKSSFEIHFLWFSNFFRVRDSRNWVL